MGVSLTYHVRTGQLTAVLAGRVFQVPTHKDSSGLGGWEKVQELKPGTHTLWDHCFEQPHQRLGSLRSLPHGMPAETLIQRLGAASSVAAKLKLYDMPGEYAPRFDGVPGVHNHPGSTVYVGDRQTGVYIHGWPPCAQKRCVVVLRQWDELVKAVASEAELSFAIAF